MRQDLGSVPKHRPEFGSLGHIGSGFSPGPGPMGSLRQDLGSVPKPDIPLSRPEMGSILSSGRRLTVPVTYEDSGIESSEFQDISGMRQICHKKEWKNEEKECLV